MCVCGMRPISKRRLETLNNSLNIVSSLLFLPLVYGYVCDVVYIIYNIYKLMGDVDCNRGCDNKCTWDVDRKPKERSSGKEQQVHEKRKTVFVSGAYAYTTPLRTHY